MRSERNEGIIALKTYLNIDVGTPLNIMALEICFDDENTITCTQTGDFINYDAAITAVPYDQQGRLELLRKIMTRAAVYILENEDIIYLDQETLVVRAAYCFNADGMSAVKMIDELRGFGGRLASWIESVSELPVAERHSPFHAMQNI